MDIKIFANSVTKIVKKCCLALVRNINKNIEEVINELDYCLIAHRK